MAGRRPAKIASKKKGKAVGKICPETGKPMIVVKLIRADGPSGMFWVHEDFDGSDKSVGYAIPVR